MCEESPGSDCYDNGGCKLEDLVEETYCRNEGNLPENVVVIGQYLNDKWLYRGFWDNNSMQNIYGTKINSKLGVKVHSQLFTYIWDSMER